MAKTQGGGGGHGRGRGRARDAQTGRGRGGRCKDPSDAQLTFGGGPSDTSLLKDFKEHVARHVWDNEVF